MDPARMTGKRGFGLEAEFTAAELRCSFSTTRPLPPLTAVALKFGLCQHASSNAVSDAVLMQIFDRGADTFMRGHPDSLFHRHRLVECAPPVFDMRHPEFLPQMATRKVAFARLMNERYCAGRIFPVRKVTIVRSPRGVRS